MPQKPRMTASTTATTGADNDPAPRCAVNTENQLDTILIKVASRCNFDCSYCYVYQGPDTTWRSQPKRMRQHVSEAVRERLIEQAEHQHAGFAIVLHGGEPLLLGLEKLAAMLYGLRVNLQPERYPISIQTNGALLNEKMLDLFAETRTSVSVSIDGPLKVNNLARLDHQGRSTFSETLRGIHLLTRHSESEFLFSGTLSVIHPTANPVVVYEFLKSLGTPSMDFLLQDGNHERLPPGKNNFESTEYGQWLTYLLDLYLSDPSPVPIRVADDTIKLCLGGTSLKEGLGQKRYGILTIETNGEIRKNDTLRASFDGADKFDYPWSVFGTSLPEILSSEEYIDYTSMQSPSSSTCQQCPLFSICGGGMPLYRWSTDRGYDNPSVYCHDHQIFIRHVISRLQNFVMHNSLVLHGSTIDVS